MGLVGGVFCTLVALITLASYTDDCSVSNASGIDALSNHVLCLRVLGGGRFDGVSSYSIMRKRFRFRKAMSSTEVTGMFVSSRPMLPLILRTKAVAIGLSSMRRMMDKAPLGSGLFKFFGGCRRLRDRRQRLIRGRSRTVVGKDSVRTIATRLGTRTVGLSRRRSGLIAAFVASGFRGILKPNMFFLMAVNGRCPVLSP